MKKLLLLLLLAPSLLRAQTNTARMLDGVNAQMGTSYAFTCQDATHLVTFNNPAPVAVSLMAASNPCSGPGIMFSAKNIGLGVATITPVSGTINGQASLALNQNQGVNIWNDGVNYTTEGVGGSAGGIPGVFPRWDQLLNPNTNSNPDFDSTVFTFQNGVWNFNTMALLVPSAANFKATQTAQIGLDTTSSNLHFNNGQADNYVLLALASNAYLTGDVFGISNVGGVLTAIDVTVNGSGGANTSLVQINNVNGIQLGDAPCVTSVGPPVVFDPCSPGIPLNLQTGTAYTYDPVNDRAVAVVASNPAVQAYTIGPIADASNFGANWFNFQINKGPGLLNLTTSGGSIFDDTQSATETLLAGQQCTWITDETLNGGLGLIVPKCHEARLSPGTGMTFTRNPYSLILNASTSVAPITNGLINGCSISWTSLLSFNVAACTYSIAGTIYNTAATSVTLSAADPSNPRIDDIVFNTSSAVAVITGTPAANPSAPTVDPTSQILGTFVTVPAASTTPAVSQIVIYQNNAGSPTEWNCTSTANVNCNSTNNPFNGFTHSIEATTAVTGNNSVNTIGSGNVNLANYTTLSFYIRSKAAFANAKALQILWKNGSTNVGTSVTLQDGMYGFSSSNTTTYQLIGIPLTGFQTGVAAVTNLTIQVAGGGAPIGYYLGDITIQGGFNGGGSSGGGVGSGSGISGMITGQIPIATTATTITSSSDLPDVHMIPAANCPGGSAGAGWSYPAATWTAACRAGTNNLGGALQLIPATGGAAQFRIELPADWDTTSQPFIRIEYGSGTNASGTVIWTAASACTKADGSITDDPAFVSESAFATQTMAVASRAWAQTGQFVNVTSGNNCVPGGGIIMRLTLSGTAAAAINAYQAVVTIPRKITVQVN